MYNFKHVFWRGGMLCLFTLLVCINIQAQTLRITNTAQNGIQRTDSLWFTHDEYVNYVFGNLAFSQVSTNYLLERSLSSFEPEYFDGKNNDDKIIKSVGHFYSLYNTIYYSALDTAASYAIVHPTELSVSAKTWEDQGYIPLILLNRSYNTIKQNALFDGLFTTNSDSTILYDNPNRTTSPYSQKRVFITTAYSKNRPYRSLGEVKFFIAPDNLHFTDTLSGQIEVDFGDGNGYQYVTINTSKTVNYNSSGIKIIKVKQGSMVSTSEFDFVKRDIFFETSFFQAFGTNTFSSQAVITQFLGCDRTLDKPILIIEGFEIQDDMDSETILDGLNRNGLVTQLQNQGYDFMVIKFSDNTASILQNASALRSAIISINNSKSGNHKLNVIGLSMGGLIAKYCLKDMEDNSLIHNVENYFSYDSPHQGAYVPVGLQHLISDASYAVKDIRENELVKRILTKLNSTAAKQLLQLTSTNSGRSSFASAYHNKGYPAQCNKYAIANGRGDGIGLGYPAGAQLIHFYAEVNNVVRRALKHTQKLWAVNTSRSDVSYLSNKGIAATFGLKGLKNYSSSISYAAEVLHETLPGSTERMHSIYGENLRDGFRSQDDDPDLELFERRITTFVPTVSALDLNNQSYTQNGFYISRNPYYDVSSNHTSVLANNITPFDDILYPVSASQEHLDMTAIISNWIFTKIIGAVPPASCSSLCSSIPSFNQNFNNCSNGERGITMSNAPTGVTINWSFPAPVQIVSGQGTNNIKVSSGSSGTFNGTVTLTWPGCTSSSYAVPVTISVLDGTFWAQDLEVGQERSIYFIQPTPHPNWTYSWVVDGPIDVYSRTDQSSIDFYTLDKGNLYVWLTITDPCGNTNTLSDVFYIYGYQFAMYPNPASEEIIVSKGNNNTKDKTVKYTSRKIDIMLLDDKGKVLKHKEMYDESQVSLDVRNIANGIYFVHIKDGKKTVKKQIILQH
ncbi:T9SS type A sorting domain-containing protein [Paradesertivirga mongoliensis]|uniref:T9SS type A sorting domain-containing protein n=1 Tax=Paradesertivirga mongoliensis TaxID=2100740 RepID=A0ABW4ZGB7_9SPHI|nr:T9SS type A sorting domain-containing protein [Pedobacter mongoliensis]